MIDALESARTPILLADASAVAAAGEAFGVPWVRWNLARALASCGAMACLGVALSR